MQVSRLLRPASIALLVCVSLPAFAKETIKLGSGTSVEIEGAEPIKTNGWNAVAVMYQTKLRLDDTAKLRREADEIWDKLAPGADSGDYSQGVIEATGAPKGVVKPAPVTFVYQRKKGAWRATDFAKGEMPKLTEANVTAMMRRSDAAIELLEINAAKLYLAKDWSATISYYEPGQSNPTTKDIGVDDYARTLNEARANSSDYHHARSITGIAIAPDGQSAEVQSTEHETVVTNGKQLDISANSHDTVGLDDGSIVIAKSSTEQTK